MEKIKYAIKSNVNGKYLSNLFEDTHSAMFQGTRISRDDCYFWDIGDIAEDVARNENGSVVPFWYDVQKNQVSKFMSDSE